MLRSIEAKLKTGLQPQQLDIVDESHLHVGHKSARAEGESHFRVSIVSELFVGRSRIERQRMVFALLDKELATDVHALSLTTRTPEEESQAKNL